MEEKELKTSLKQRIIISAIAIIMLGSTIAGYAVIVMNGGKTNSSGNTEGEVDEALIAQYEEAYEQKRNEFQEASKADFEKFVGYKSEVKAYNETSANESGVKTKDLAVGTGREIGEGDTDYLAYYIGFCADESIFDSSFNDETNPTGFKDALNPKNGLIEGWNAGVVGMKIGGVREITVPGELGYGDSMEICGGLDKPLKFIVMAVANDGVIKTLSDELQTASLRLQYAYYGMDYDSMATE